ncbi:TPA: DUF2806 domain-containing protein [Escherichia coli]|nr:DUF2806 domain-containing protein [Escherichia coli]
MDKGLDVNINAELKADLQPVIASTPNALSKLFDLLFGVKHAERKHTIEMIEAQKIRDKAAIADGMAIFSIEEKKLKIIDDRSENETSSLIKNKVSNDEIRNILRCAKHSATELLDKEIPSDKEISNDFFNRWRNEAKLIDDEYAQSIWGRVLAEEIQHPETISLRTLDVLKNLSKSEAELFNNMGNYVVFDSSLITGSHISEPQIKILTEAGLVIFAGVYRNGTWLRTRLTYKDSEPVTGHYLDFNSTLFFNNEIQIEEDINISFIPLTEQGKAIYKIAAKNNSWDPKLIASAIFEKNKKLKTLTTYKYSNYLKNNNIDMDNPIYYNREDFDLTSTEK